MWQRRVMIVLILLSAYASAGEHAVMFPYSALYPSLKFNAQYHYAKAALFMVEPHTQQRCLIQSAWLEDNHHRQIPIAVTHHDEIQLPVTLHWQQQRPAVYIKTWSSKPCQIQIMIINQQTYGLSVTLAELHRLAQEMQQLMQALGRQFTGWKAPKVTGVAIELRPIQPPFPTTLTTRDGHILPVHHDQVLVRFNELTDDDVISLPNHIRYIHPKIFPGQSKK